MTNTVIAAGYYHFYCDWSNLEAYNKASKHSFWWNSMNQVIAYFFQSSVESQLLEQSDFSFVIEQ